MGTIDAGSSGMHEKVAPSSLMVLPLCEGRVRVSFGADTFLGCGIGCKSMVSKGWVSGEGTTKGPEAPPQRLRSAFLNSSIWVLRAWFSCSKILTLSSDEVFVFLFPLSNSVIT